MAALLNRPPNALTVVDDCDRPLESSFADIIFGRERLEGRVSRKTKKNGNVTVFGNQQCYYRGQPPPAPSRLHGGSDSEQRARADARFQRHLNVPARGDEDVHVRCHEPGALPFEQQVALSRKTSTTVSFHGTVSYLVLFQRDGTSAVIVGRTPLKETDVMFHLTHVNVLYVKLEHMQRDYAPALRSALKHAARYNRES
jgi:hypothetical protein